MAPPSLQIQHSKYRPPVGECAVGNMADCILLLTMDFIYFSFPCNVQCQIGLSFSIGICSGSHFVSHQARDWLHVPWVGDHCMVSCRPPLWCIVPSVTFLLKRANRYQSDDHQNRDIFAQVLCLEFNMKDQIVTGTQYYLLFVFPSILLHPSPTPKIKSCLVTGGRGSVWPYCSSLLSTSFWDGTDFSMTVCLPLRTVISQYT